MGRTSDFLFVLVATLLLAACSQGERTKIRHSVPRDVLVGQYLLFNEQRQPRASTVPGGSAMGMFLKAPEEWERGECVATHVAYGLVATNAHCAKDHQFLPLSDFFVLFYNRFDGKLTHANVTGVVRVGDEALDDVAFFKISDQTADQWDHLGVTVNAGYMKYPLAGSENQPRNWKAEAPQVHKVTVLGFDPLASRPEFRSFYRGRPGAIFSPKQCYMDRTIPWRASGLFGGEPQGASKFEASNKLLHWELHLFFDRCDVTTRAGNSGSPVFAQSGELAGFFHWNLAKRDFSPGEFYLGSARVWFDVWDQIASLPEDTAIFNVGSVFDYLVNRRYPNLREHLPAS